MNPKRVEIELQGLDQIHTEYAGLVAENARLRAALEKSLVFLNRCVEHGKDTHLAGVDLCSVAHYASFHADNARAALGETVTP